MNKLNVLYASKILLVVALLPVIWAIGCLVLAWFLLRGVYVLTKSLFVER